MFLLSIHTHLLDDLEIAEPPDLIDIDPLEEAATELGALLSISILYYLRTSSIKGPNSGNSFPKLINEETNVLYLSF